MHRLICRIKQKWPGCSRLDDGKKLAIDEMMRGMEQLKVLGGRPESVLAQH